ncbi:thiamine-phosphate diphosphorylase [Sphaerotilus hippei]|uniref:hydroxymethylpyrimidine kinase n=1 Tax=Sphaerotilus hippei TaxID=744406 RepID=A0A318H3Q5_9BURK|nr:bifunctional hydroxymethylpyrimidine kinase/phosphomethylpyrimidine kinase [Sphaerotilus hippei]PXW98074.1 thiamine-phosphate diphosphorylase [Sphaerotilus hippei]
MSDPRPIVWSIAGNDSGGGAGLAADQRAALGAEVHLCPVVAAVTAQNSVAVTRIEALPVAWLEAQLEALATDLPPDAVKTGLLAGVATVQVVARHIDTLRRRHPGLPLVVDPVLRASTGAAFADAALVQAYAAELLPRATVITPNRREARALLAAAWPQRRHEIAHWPVPALAAALRELGAQAVCITGGDEEPGGTAAPAGWALDWVDAPVQAPGRPEVAVQGWLALPRLDTAHHHGTGCTHATHVAAALARGFVAAEAMVMAKMATTTAIARGHPAGTGAGPVGSSHGGLTDATHLPWMSWGDDLSDLATTDRAGTAPSPSPSPLPAGLYALFDDTRSLARALDGLQALGEPAAPMAAVQLRIKREAHPDLDDRTFDTWLATELQAGWQRARDAAVTLFVNDHWETTLRTQAQQPGPICGLGVHLGQEDLERLGPAGRQRLRTARRAGLQLGVSSHSLWELCRAAGLRPDYLACGPVWPTTTKDMPWQPQGLDNLAWWAHLSPVPVVAIGGILEPAQLAPARRAGARAVCLVRAWRHAGQQQLLAWSRAWLTADAVASDRLPVPARPHPSLPHARLPEASSTAPRCAPSGHAPESSDIVTQRV